MGLGELLGGEASGGGGGGASDARARVTAGAQRRERCWRGRARATAGAQRRKSAGDGGRAEDGREGAAGSRVDG